MLPSAHPSRSHSRWRHHTSCLARYTEPTRHRTTSSLCTWILQNQTHRNVKRLLFYSTSIHLLYQTPCQEETSIVHTVGAAFDCYTLFKGFIRTVAALSDAVTQSVARHAPTVRTSVAVVTTLVRRAEIRIHSWNLRILGTVRGFFHHEISTVLLDYFSICTRKT